jgi:hypothetical protein
MFQLTMNFNNGELAAVSYAIPDTSWSATPFTGWGRRCWHGWGRPVELHADWTFHSACSDRLKATRLSHWFASARSLFCPWRLLCLFRRWPHCPSLPVAARHYPSPSVTAGFTLQ